MTALSDGVKLAQVYVLRFSARRYDGFMSGAGIKVDQQKPQPLWRGYFLLTAYLNAFWIVLIGLILYGLCADKGFDGPYDFVAMMPKIWFLGIFLGLLNGCLTGNIRNCPLLVRKKLCRRIDAFGLLAISIPVALFLSAETKITQLLLQSPENFFALTLAGTLATSLSAQLTYVAMFERCRNLRPGAEEIKRLGKL
ncbi:MAG: hypothetical protein KGS72_01385 [Cyanobacteria bacterium REEB67]|nr:hypothetical protein [Cyanobacteria bacterium REEB67]